MPYDSPLVAPTQASTWLTLACLTWFGPQLVPGFYTGVVDMDGRGGNGYAEFGSVNAAPTTFNRQNIYTLSDDVNWIRGKHSFKFGVLLNRYNEASQATNSFNGQIHLQSVL